MTSADSPGAAEPRIGLWGRFETERPGDLVRPLVYEALLRCRLPGVTIEPAAVLGPGALPAARWGLPVEDLGSYGAFRLGPSLALADAIVVCGESGIASDTAFASTAHISLDDARRRRPSAFFLEGPVREVKPGRPFVWSAVGVPVPFSAAEAPRIRAALEGCALLSVRDEASRERLLQTEFSGEVVVVPDPLLLSASLLEERTLERRRDHLRRLGSFPAPPARPVVIGINALPAERAEQVGHALRGGGLLAAPVVLLDLGPIDEEVVARFGAALGQPVLLLPPEATARDVAATMSGASLVLAFDDDLALLARGLRVPVIRLLAEAGSGRFPGGLEDVPILPLADLASFLETAGPLSPDPLDPVPETTSSSIGRHFDRIAELTSAARSRSFGMSAHPTAAVEGELRRMKQHVALWRRCVEGLAERSGESRLRLAEAVQKAELEKRLLEAGRAEAAEDVRRLTQELSTALAALEMMKADLEWTRREVHRVRTETTRLSAERDETISGLAALRTEAEGLAAELEAGRTERQRMAADSEVLRAQLEERSASLATARSEIESTEAALEVTKTDLEWTRGEVARVSAEKVCLSAERDAAVSDLVALRAEADRFSTALDVERRRRAELETERVGWDQFGAGAFSELSVLRDRIAVTAAERDELSAAREALVEEIASLHASIDRSRGRLLARLAGFREGGGLSSRRRPGVRDRET